MSRAHTAGRPIANRPQLNKLPHKAAAATKPGRNQTASEEADQGVGRGPGGPPHKIAA